MICTFRIDRNRCPISSKICWSEHRHSGGRNDRQTAGGARHGGWLLDAAAHWRSSVPVSAVPLRWMCSSLLSTIDDRGAGLTLAGLRMLPLLLSLPLPLSVRRFPARCSMFCALATCAARARRSTCARSPTRCTSCEETWTCSRVGITRSDTERGDRQSGAARRDTKGDRGLRLS